eukprot:7844301-Karenia_brevis.AAC.1
MAGKSTLVSSWQELPASRASTGLSSYPYPRIWPEGHGLQSDWTHSQREFPLSAGRVLDIRYHESRCHLDICCPDQDDEGL